MKLLLLWSIAAASLAAAADDPNAPLTSEQPERDYLHYHDTGQAPPPERVGPKARAVPPAEGETGAAPEGEAGGAGGDEPSGSAAAAPAASAGSDAPPPAAETPAGAGRRKAVANALRAAQSLKTAMPDLGADPMPRPAPPGTASNRTQAPAAQDRRPIGHEAAEPAALMRRPDFYQVLPREKFQGLKRAYAAQEKTRAAAFADIAMTPGGRDFVWSASCSRVSGDCNPYAAESTYRKTEEVSPETLNRVERALADQKPRHKGASAEELDRLEAEADAQFLQETTPLPAAPANRIAYDDILGRIKGMFENILGGAPIETSEVGREGDLTSGRAASRPAAEGSAPGAPRLDGREPGAPVETAAPPSRERPWLIFSILAAALILGVMIRRRMNS